VLDGKDVRFVGIGKGKFEALFDTVPELLNKLGIKKKDGEGKGGKGRHGKAKHDDGKDPEQD